MGRSIEVRVDGRGRLTADFRGFLGDACFEEADRLAKVLASLGLGVQPDAVRPKALEEQLLEAGLSPEVKPGGEVRT